MAHLYRVLVPVTDISREESFYVSDPFGNPLCFVARESVFTG